jgi:predicted metal-dependent HD superfamily phosphohydrolase
VKANRERFAALLRRLGATGDPLPAADDILAAYAAPERTYHGIAHLDDCLTQLDQAATDAAHRDRVEAALWFHDVVYDSRRDDNERRSAAWARRLCQELSVPAAITAEIERLVGLTDHRTPPTDASGRLLCDIDLSILGRPPEQFDAYDRAIRGEYASVPEEAYRVGRRRVLEGLLAREALYGTNQFRQRYEATARANLRRALARLAPPWAKEDKAGS